MSVQTSTREPRHAMLCSDARGEELLITIRVAADGRVYLHDITPDFLPVAVALAPDDPDLKQRAELAKRIHPTQSAALHPRTSP